MARIDKDGVLRGKIGDLVYRNYRGKQIVQRVADDTKKSENVKKNNTTFGYASSKESAIRKFFIDTLNLQNDGNLHNRHRKILYELLIHNLDKKNDKKLLDGNPKQYIGLNFNINSTWENFMPYYISIIQIENKLRIEIPTLHSKLFLKKLKALKIDHLKLSLNIICIDPDLEQNPNAILFNQREWTLYMDQKIDEQIWEINNLPPNRFIMVIGKIEYFEMNSIYGLKSINNKDLYPACVLYATKF